MLILLLMLPRYIGARRPCHADGRLRLALSLPLLCLRYVYYYIA